MTTLKKLLILIPALVLINKASAAHTLDSLIRTCKKTGQHDTDFIKCIDLKSFELSNSDPQLGLLLAQKALQLARNIGWSKGIALANNEMAVNYKMLAEPDSAIIHFKASLEEFGRAGNKTAQSGVLANLSQVYQKRGDYVQALKLLNDAYKLREQEKSSSASGIILENIGTIHMELKDLKKAKEYYYKARTIYRNNADSISLARNMINLGILLDKHGEYDSAIRNFSDALLINRKINRLQTVQVCHANLGLAYLHKKDFEKAVHQLTEAVRISEKMGSRYALATSIGNLGVAFFEKFETFRKMEDLEQAIQNLRSGFELCEQIGYAPPQIEFGETLVKAIEYRGKDYKLALQVMRRSNFLKDSIFSMDNTILINRLESEKELALKENELQKTRFESRLAMEESEKHRIEKIILIQVVIMLALLVTVLYLGYINRNRLFRRRMHEISQFQSHELRTPVVKILYIVEELRSGKADKAEIERLLNLLKSSTDELDLRIHEVVNRAR